MRTLELVSTDRRTYVQVKMRGGALGNADVEDALARFATYRAFHLAGTRAGHCEFVVATNATPTLLARSIGGEWPGAVPTAAAPMPPPPSDLTASFAALAPESLIRVGQDLVDEFVGRRDYDGAREVFQDSLLPILRDLNLTGHVISVRAQHAVVLAYCQRFDDAEAEMSRLVAYEPALSDVERSTLARQRGLIAQLRRDGPCPQWFEQLSRAKGGLASLQLRSRKVGRNQACPCGSGSKFKRCCGR